MTGGHARHHGSNVARVFDRKFVNFLYDGWIEVRPNIPEDDFAVSHLCLLLLRREQMHCVTRGIGSDIDMSPNLRAMLRIVAELVRSSTVAFYFLHVTGGHARHHGSFVARVFDRKFVNFLYILGLQFDRKFVNLLYDGWIGMIGASE